MDADRDLTNGTAPPEPSGATGRTTANTWDPPTQWFDSPEAQRRERTQHDYEYEADEGGSSAAAGETQVVPKLDAATASASTDFGAVGGVATGPPDNDNGAARHAGAEAGGAGEEGEAEADKFVPVPAPARPRPSPAEMARLQRLLTEYSATPVLAWMLADWTGPAASILAGDMARDVSHAAYVVPEPAAAPEPAHRCEAAQLPAAPEYDRASPPAFSAHVSGGFQSSASGKVSRISTP